MFLCAIIFTYPLNLAKSNYVEKVFCVTLFSFYWTSDLTWRTWCLVLKRWCAGISKNIYVEKNKINYHLWTQFETLVILYSYVHRGLFMTFHVIWYLRFKIGYFNFLNSKKVTTRIYLLFAALLYLTWKKNQRKLPHWNAVFYN